MRTIIVVSDVRSSGQDTKIPTFPFAKRTEHSSKLWGRRVMGFVGWSARNVLGHARMARAREAAQRSPEYSTKQHG